MRGFILGSLVAAAVSSAPAVTSANDSVAQRTNDHLSTVEIQRRVEIAGYTNVKNIELDAEDGQYEVDALSGGGQEVDLHVDPHSGQIVPERD